MPTDHQVSDLNIIWRDLGCPIEPGFYLFAGKKIEVRRGDIERAAGNPDSLFPVVTIIVGDETRHVLAAVD